MRVKHRPGEDGGDIVNLELGYEREDSRGEAAAEKKKPRRSLLGGGGMRTKGRKSVRATTRRSSDFSEATQMFDQGGGRGSFAGRQTENRASQRENANRSSPQSPAAALPPAVQAKPEVLEEEESESWRRHSCASSLERLSLRSEMEEEMEEEEVYEEEEVKAAPAPSRAVRQPIVRPSGAPLQQDDDNPLTTTMRSLQQNIARWHTTFVPAPAPAASTQGLEA